MPNREDLLEKIYKEIIHMKKRRKQDRFFDRLDMLFSVLVSITIFTVGIMINNSITQTNINFEMLITGSALLIVFTISLIGQYIAILSNNITRRFYFWAVLISGVTQTVFLYCMLFWIPRPIPYFEFQTIWYLGAVVPTILVPLILKNLLNRYKPIFPNEQKQIKQVTYLKLVLISLFVMIIIRLPQIVFSIIFS